LQRRKEWKEEERNEKTKGRGTGRQPKPTATGAWATESWQYTESWLLVTPRSQFQKYRFGEEVARLHVGRNLLQAL
jgi:fructosamine-3-kinase